MTTTCVLDSWAVLAYLQSHRTSDSVSAVIDDVMTGDRAVMNWINLGEVAYVLQRRYGRAEALTAVQDLRAAVSVCLPDESLVLSAADIKANYPMAYADAFVAATALRFDAPVWTGDPELLIPGAPWQWQDLRA
jgi:predicted nucleic acid-binding protein